MLGVVSMIPSRPGGGFTSAGPEMALIAVFGQVMTYSAVCITFTVIISALWIQPGLAQWMGDILAMTIVTGRRIKVISPHNRVARVADFFLQDQPGMRGAVMGPARAGGRHCSIRSEMTDVAASADFICSL